MKQSVAWLRELASPDVDDATLARRLTLAGVMVDAVAPAAPALDGIIVGRIVACEPHPNADKLQVCDVDTGDATHRIVCGASNARAGLHAPVALPGTTLPGGVTIERAELRGVASNGMLCSGRELGLSDDHEGLLELPTDTRVGAPLTDALQLDDIVFEFDLTPNRGDCLSALGLAREVAAVFDLDPPVIEVGAVTPAIDDTRRVAIADEADCGVYCGRVVRGVDATRQSPLWLKERLRRAGIKPRNAVVDVAAYVMLELGQPLHMFDHATLDGGITVRRAKQGEPLTLLDGTDVELDPDVLVIADDQRAVAMAGIMGGEATAVSDRTRDVFIESAWFAPFALAGRARRFGLHTDASHRYERGVDPALAPRALERATELLVQLAGGEAGPVTTAGKPAPAWREGEVTLRRERLTRLLGVAVPDDEVERALTRLGFGVTADRAGWRARVPSHRFDIAIEADLVEEVARLVGYDRIPSGDAPMPTLVHPVSETRVADRELAATLVHRGFQQVVTYSFVDPSLQAALGLGEHALALKNPMSSELAEMRTSLWPGLLGCLQHNAKRQQARVRIFEMGLRFISQADELRQEKQIAGLAWGERHPRQWGLPAVPTDFYDLKAELVALCGPIAPEFVADRHPALHPGQSARIVIDGETAGWIGTLHPKISQKLDLTRAPVLFELAVDKIAERPMPAGRAASRFPALRRDFALVVDEAVPVGAILAAVDAIAPDWLAERFIFDIYRGQGVEAGRKSVALGLILQETSRTLTDGEADAFGQRLVAHLGASVGATLRD